MVPTNGQTHYALLEVLRNASDAAIKQSYHRLALKFHPDKDRSSLATARFQAIGQAYEVLSDAGRRQAYDATLPLPHAAPFETPPRPTPAPTAAATPATDDKRKLQTLNAQIQQLHAKHMTLESQTASLASELQHSHDAPLADLAKQAAAAEAWVKHYSSLGSLATPVATREQSMDDAQREHARLLALIGIKCADRDRVQTSLDALTETQRVLEKQIVDAHNQQTVLQGRQRQREARRANAQRREAEQRRREQREANERRWQQEWREALGRRAPAGDCGHRGHWPKREGPGACVRCGCWQWRVLLACPRCGMQVCRGCRMDVGMSTDGWD